MSNIPRVYRSTDPGAPQLSGQPGALAGVLDAVLVDGYGAGADAKAPLGWIREFTGTNKRVFRNDPAEHAGYRIRFDDTNARYVLVNGYAAMTDVDTGVEQFGGAGHAWAKSNASNSDTRHWVIVGTGGCAYLFIWHQGGDETNVYVGGRFFGDLKALGPSNSWAFAFSASDSTSYTSGAVRTGLFYGASTGSYGFGLIAARDSTGTVIEQRLFHRRALFSTQNVYGGSSGGYPFPFPTTGGTVFSRAMVDEGSYPHSLLPGCWVAEHNDVYTNQFATYEGFPDFPEGTRLLLAFSNYSNSGSQTNSARAFLDITNSW